MYGRNGEKSLWRIVSEVNLLPSKEAIKIQMHWTGWILVCGDSVMLQIALLMSVWWRRGLVCHYSHIVTRNSAIRLLAHWPRSQHPPPPNPKERAGAHCLLMREIFFIKVLCTSLSVQKIIRIQRFLWTRLQRRFNLQNPNGILLFRRGSIIFPALQKGNKSIYQKSPVGSHRILTSLRTWFVAPLSWTLSAFTTETGYYCAQTPPNSHEEKGSGVTSPNPLQKRGVANQIAFIGIMWKENKYFNHTAQSVLWDSLSNTEQFVILVNSYKASTLAQAQGFRLVTPGPFLMRELGLGMRLHYSLSKQQIARSCSSLFWWNKHARFVYVTNVW